MKKEKENIKIEPVFAILSDITALPHWPACWLLIKHFDWYLCDDDVNSGAADGAALTPLLRCTQAFLFQKEQQQNKKDLFRVRD